MNFFTNANIMIAGSMHLIFINYHYRVMEQQWVSLLLITKEIFINVSICFAENSMRLEGVPVTRELLQWYDGKVSPQCEDCEVLPLCQGGCVTKPRIGRDAYVCHMMKYRLKVQESLKVRMYLKGGERNEGD